jgi:hypothetical protein
VSRDVDEIELTWEPGGLRAYVDLRCTYFVPWCSDYPDDTSLRMFADKVMPEFK